MAAVNYPFLSLGAGGYTLSEWYDLYQQNAGYIPDRVLQVMYINIAFTILTMLLILTTLYYFFRLSRYLPKLFIAFILLPSPRKPFRKSCWLICWMLMLTSLFIIR